MKEELVQEIIESYMEDNSIYDVEWVKIAKPEWQYRAMLKHLINKIEYEADNDEVPCVERLSRIERIAKKIYDAIKD